MSSLYRLILGFLEKLEINHRGWLHMVGFFNLLLSKEKPYQQGCPKGRTSRMCWKGRAASTRGVAYFPRKERYAAAGTSDLQAWRPQPVSGRKLCLAWVAPGIWTIHSNFRHLGHWKGSQRKFHLFIVFGCCVWIPHWPQEMEWFFSSLPSTSPKLSPYCGPVGQTRGSRAGQLAPSLLLNFSPLCLFSLIDIPALETRSWLLSHFRISFWGSWNTCPLIACHSASGPSWQACLLWLMMWLMDKIRKNIQKNISVWAGVSASLHQVAAEGIFCCMPHYTVMAFPGKAVSFHDTRQQAALWALGPPSPEEGEAL